MIGFKWAQWLDKKLTASLGFLVFTHLIQIPHMIWNADLYLELGSVSRLNPVYDFVLYGVDLIEIPAIIVVTLQFAQRITQRLNNTKDIKK